MDGDDEGGDPVCWVDQVCPECGAMPSPEQNGSDDDGDRCWRCHAT